MIKLIAIDIDGTLITSNHLITDEVKQAIQTALNHGVKIVLCTGRPTPSAMTYVNELNLNNTDDYLITYNGAVMHRLDSKDPIYQQILEYSDIQDLFACAEKFNTHVHAISDHGIYTPNKDISRYTVLESWLTHMPLFYETPNQLDPHTVYNKLMMVDEPSILDYLVAHLDNNISDRYTILRSEPYYLEFVNNKASKGRAVARLMTKLNLSKDQVMGIGDSGNDLDLMTSCGIGVAMGNATEELKELADYITDTNDNNGVAKAIQKFIDFDHKS